MGSHLSSLASVFTQLPARLLSNLVIFSLLPMSPARLCANVRRREPKRGVEIRILLAFLWSGVVLGSAGLAGRVAVADEPALVQVPESVLRNLATKTVMPLYPEVSKKQGVKGIAVAQVHGNEKGVLTSIKVLEAPDSEIQQAVIEAIKQWYFKPAYVDGKLIVFEGKLTFYFVINGGRARVENPRKFKKQVIAG